MFRLRKSILICTTALVLAGCSQGDSKQTGNNTASTNNSGDTINVKIATANALTGQFAHWGQDAANGIKLAIDQANTKNITWNGKKVHFEYLSEDDQGDPKTAAQVATAYVDKQINAMVGHLTTGPTMVASKIYHQNGIPEIVYSVTGPDFTKQGYDNVFRVISNDDQQGDALANYAVKKLGIKTFAVVQDKTAYGEGLANAFTAAAQKLGAKLVDTQYTNTSATEFGAIVTALKKDNPDLVFYGGMDSQAAPLVREMRKQGMTTKFMSADGIKTAEFLKLAHDSAEGVYASTTGAPKESMPGFAPFNEAYKKAFNQEVVSYSPYAYDATNVIINAMNEAKSDEPAKYLPFLRKTNYKGVTGNIEFKENGDIKNAIVTLYLYKDGKWQILK